MSRTKVLAATAVLAALAAVVTVSLRIPLAAGYFNFGDTVILLSAFILRPGYAALVAIGPMLTDLIGFPVYALPTLVIKAVEAAFCSALAGYLYRKGGKIQYVGIPIVVISGLLMTAGYAVFEFFAFRSVWIANIVPNLLQSLISAGIACVLVYALKLPRRVTPLLTKVRKNAKENKDKPPAPQNHSIADCSDNNADTEIK